MVLGRCNRIPTAWPIACAVMLGSMVSACGDPSDPVKVCETYARNFAEVAAGTCRRGAVETNVAAFKSAARVGESCELVAEVRDLSALESECFPWLRNELPLDCTLLDSPERYVAAMPDACKGQLRVAGN